MITFDMIKRAKKLGACPLAVMCLKSGLHNLDELPPPWRHWAAVHMPELRDELRPLITDSEWAYWWARDIGDIELMRSIVTEPKWLHWWTIDIDQPSDEEEE